MVVVVMLAGILCGSIAVAAALLAGMTAGPVLAAYPLGGLAGAGGALLLACRAPRAAPARRDLAPGRS